MEFGDVGQDADALDTPVVAQQVVRTVEVECRRRAERIALVDVHGIRFGGAGGLHRLEVRGVRVPRLDGNCCRVSAARVVIVVVFLPGGIVRRQQDGIELVLRSGAAEIAGQRVAPFPAA